jgi:NhaA family Na+:H+ antiporter
VGRAFQEFTTVRDWVNGGLMAVFFLVVGLEIGRERRHGELADPRTAMVPIAGALGGMVGAGLVYAAVAHGGPGSSGWGIPMATDIAFALGALALLGRRVPPGLRVVLLTLAVADDIGSIVVLAGFYSSRTYLPAVAAAIGVVAVLVVLRRTTRVSTAVALGGGVVLWLLLAAGGVEPALAGVVAGLTVPGTRAVGGRARGPGSPVVVDPAARLEAGVAPWSAFVVLPVFAVANAGITFHAGILAPPGATAVFVGVGLARVLGKLGGITLACLLVVRLGLGRLPGGVRWHHLAGGAAVAGIGFTVPLLIAELAFASDPPLVTAAELGLFAGSALAFAVGAAVLVWSGPGPAGAEAGAPPADDGPRVTW